MSDPLQQLKTLAELRDSGVITDEEFELKKAELLSLVAAESRTNPLSREQYGATTSGMLEAQPSPVDLETLPSDELPGKVHADDLEFWRNRSRMFDGRAIQAKSAHDACVRSLRRSRWSAAYWLLLLRIRRNMQPIWLLGTTLIAMWCGGALGVVVATTLQPGLLLALTLILAFALIGFGLSVHVLYFPNSARVRLLYDEQKSRQQLLEPDEARLERELQRERDSSTHAEQVYRRLLDAHNSETHNLLSTNWRALRGIPFEEFLQRVFRNAGYFAEMTKASGDQGVDLIVTRGNDRIAVQVKGFVNSVGNGAVQQAHAGMAYYRCTKCAVVTNSEFTPAARELADRVGCQLIDCGGIEALITGRIYL